LEDYYFLIKNLSVGYNKKILIHDINMEIEKGTILTLIGPNGAGKSTILKSITKHLDKISGDIYIEGREVHKLTAKETSKKISVMLTDRLNPELMTCQELVSMGRYPYTNSLGKLTQEDESIVEESLTIVKALELADKQFTQLSDGQKQRVLLARAICQEPELMVLDEPTAYLDIRHKIELLDILRQMSREKKITIIMSLHEIDLASKISDYLLCVKGDNITDFGPADKVFNSDVIEELYDMENGSFNILLGSVELAKPKGEADVFVIAGNGYGIPIFRSLQKYELPFATGVLYENDIDYQVAKELSDNLVIAPAFEEITERQYEKALNMIDKCKALIDSGTPVGKLNAINSKLIEYARSKNIPVFDDMTSFYEKIQGLEG